MQLQILAQLLSIDVAGPLVDIDKFGNRTRLRNRLGRRNEGVRDSQNALPGHDARSDQGESKGVGSTAYSHTVFGIAEAGEGLLKSATGFPPINPAV